MNPLVFGAVVLAGGTGAALRYLLDVLVTRVAGARVPWGILVVNLTGALALGLVSVTVSSATGLAVLGVGLLGGYTTFSSVAVSTVMLARERRRGAALGYGLGSFAGSVLAAAAGLALGSLLV